MRRALFQDIEDCLDKINEGVKEQNNMWVLVEQAAHEGEVSVQTLKTGQKFLLVPMWFLPKLRKILNKAAKKEEI